MFKIDDFTIDDVLLLSDMEADLVLKEIKNLQQYWIQRHPVEPFYSLGATHYFDIVSNPTVPYYQMAEKYNHILRSHLGWLYELLSETLSKYLNAPVKYTKNLAMPGFHIFLYSSSFSQVVGCLDDKWAKSSSQGGVAGSFIHTDISQYVVEWEKREDLDFEHPISFTMPIAIPKTGAGMYVWNLQLKETFGMEQLELHQKLNSSQKYLYTYQKGVISLHSGLNYHQIAPISNMKEEDMRITLQGHGICCNGTWQLYW